VSCVEHLSHLRNTKYGFKDIVANTERVCQWASSGSPGRLLPREGFPRGDSKEPKTGPTTS
jgi:hypothetical protein